MAVVLLAQAAESTSNASWVQLASGQDFKLFVHSWLNPALDGATFWLCEVLLQLRFGSLLGS